MSARNGAGRPPRVDPEIIARLFFEGLTSRQIGRAVGLGERCVRYHLGRTEGYREELARRRAARRGAK